MSYAVRNTLILLVVLVIFIGAGWSYIYFVQQPKVDELTTKLEDKQQELTQKQEIASQYPMLQNRFDKATEYFSNYEKGLYGSSDEDKVFDFLNRINRGSAYTDFTFAFNDSTQQQKYGALNMEVSGEASYSNLVNFIRQVELSKPLNKINNISINPIVRENSHSDVSFQFSLTGYYDRVALLGSPSLTVENNLLGSIPNPFFPLIRSVAPNENNLIDVEGSTLLAVSGSKVFMLDQNGAMQTLSRGDQVYLGRLSKLNVEQGTATFELNKGGIVEELTLRVNSDGNESN